MLRHVGWLWLVPGDLGEWVSGTVFAFCFLIPDVCDGNSCKCSPLAEAGGSYDQGSWGIL